MTNKITSNPFFSIIIPAYNVADFIEPCLNSVFSQTFTNYEIIAIDDGSTDATRYILREFLKEHPDTLRLFRTQNSGLSAARNLGVEKSRGTYLIFLDGDDFLELGALQTITAALTSTQPDLLRFQIQDFYEDGHIVPHREIAIPRTNGLDAWATLATYHYRENAWAYVYNADFFKQNHFAYTPNRLAEDFGLTPLIIAKAKTFISIDALCYNYRQRSGSIMHDDAKLKLRVKDAYAQLNPLIENLSAIPRTGAISSYCVISFLTLAATLPSRDFLKYHRRAKKAGLLRHIQPSSPKNLPRAAILKFTPRFYRALFTAR